MRLSMLFLLLALSSAAWAIEVTNAELLAQIHAMREAYEGRISTLEAEIKTVKQVHSETQRVTAIQKSIDKTLGKSSEAARALTQKRFDQHDLAGGGNGVRSTSNMTLGGYTEFVYTDRGDRASSFDQYRTILELGAQFHERIKFYTELEYEHGGNITGSKTGASTDGELELEQAWVDLQFHDALNFRAGTILVPVGRYNLYHESFANNLTDRPLVSRRITPTTWWEEEHMLQPCRQ